MSKEKEIDKVRLSQIKRDIFHKRYSAEEVTRECFELEETYQEFLKWNNSGAILEKDTSISDLYVRKLNEVSTQAIRPLPAISDVYKKALEIVDVTAVKPIKQTMYLTEEERKEKIYRIIEHFKFRSVADLSTGVEIELISVYLKGTKQELSYLAKETAQFTAWWTLTFHKKLNGFPGIDTIKFTII